MSLDRWKKNNEEEATSASKTKTYEVKYEEGGKTVTTSISALTSSQARNYIKSQHPNAKIIDVYEI